MSDTRPLPINWGSTTLDGVIACIESGSRPRGGVSGIEGGVPSVGGEHLGVLGGFRFDKIRFVREEFAARQTKGWIKPGDILIVKDGATTGRVSFVGSDFPYARALLNEHVFRCAVAPPIDAKFIFYWLYSAEGNRRILLDFRGAAQGGISRGFVSKVGVSVAPVPEQHRIVDAIERYLTLLGDAVATLDRAHRNLKRYRAAVLKAAVEGRLVPTEASLASAEKRDYEPAERLLARILNERRRRWEAAELVRLKAAGRTPRDDKWKATYREPEPPRTSALPPLPGGWCWATIEQISMKVVDGVHKKPDYVLSGVPFVTVKNLTAGPGIDLENLKYVTPEDHKAFTARANPERGDLLVSKDGTLGVIRAIRTNKPFSIFVSVAMIKPVLVSMSDYLELALSSPIMQAQMVPKGSGLQHIHLEDLRQDCVPLPPVEEQSRILAAAQAQMSVAEWLHASVALTDAKLARLRQAVLKWAFEGKLVDQDPSDEPAEQLLARIGAEREAANPTKTTRGLAKGAA